MVQALPSRRCSRSRSTRAAPIISTPLGAVIGPSRPGATGTRQGPLGMQVVPTLPISQFAAGTQAMKAARNR